MTHGLLGQMKQLRHQVLVSRPHVLFLVLPLAVAFPF